MNSYPFKKNLKLFAWLPNLVTLFNLFTGFLAILMIAEGKLSTGAWLICAALCWDSLDGNIARIFRNPSLLGKELDSLADMVSFGVAPAFFALRSWHYKFSPGTLVIAFIYLGAVAYRLARFNIKGGTANFFQGMPSPAAGVTLSMVILASRANGWTDQKLFTFTLGLLMIILSALMTSQIPYPKISAMKFSNWKPLFYLGIFIFVLLRIFTNFPTALAGIFLLFSFLAPAYAFSSPEYAGHPLGKALQKKIMK